MFKKETKAQQMIESMCCLIGMHYTEKTYNNIVKILECYRSILFGKNIFNYDLVDKMTLEDVIPAIYKGFISEELISDELTYKIIIHIINDEQLSNMVNNAMEKIRNFDKIGEDYYKIIKGLYCTEAFPIAKNIIIDLNIDKSAYAYRKKEAIMLAGVVFWQEFLRFWNNGKSEMKEIEAKYGRTGMLSEKYAFHTE